MIIGWSGQTMPELPLDREMDVVAQAGYGGLELLIPKLGPFMEHHSVGDLAAGLQERKLAPLALNCIEHFNLRSDEEMAAIRRDCVRLSQLAQAIGCPTVAVVPSPKPPGMEWPKIKAQTVAALQELASIASAFRVRLAFEFLAKGWEIVQAAGCDNAGLVIDTYHFFVGGSSWGSLDEFDMDRLYMVHINDVEGRPLETLTDGDRMLPGEGIIPLGRLLRRLKARGYDGAYALEVMRPAYRERDPLEYARAGREAVEGALA
jgi:2-keto-myo-inositol isomerase